MAKQQDWTLTGQHHFNTGHKYGFYYASVELEIKLGCLSTEQCSALIANFRAELEMDFSDTIENFMNNDNAQQSTNALFVDCVNRMQQDYRIGIYQDVLVLSEQANHIRLALPTWRKNLKFVEGVTTWLLSVFHYYSSEENQSKPLPLTNGKQLIKQFAFQDLNRDSFIHSIVALGIPFYEMYKQVLQVGYGKNSILLDSSFTSETSAISANIARDKQFCSQLMKRNGLPVLNNHKVTSAQQAIQIANNIGFPVVIKPSDLDAGVGITTNIQNNAELTEAFNKAQKVSKNIILEQHYFSKDYRVTVLNGKAIQAVERVPAGVTGNGKDSIAKLIEETNKQPERSSANKRSLYPINLDSDSHKQLKQQNLSLESVPEKGHFVQLKSTANIASGGEPVAVLDKAHPDNIILAERAANILRLNLAGVDLMIPDISQSWLESGANICEVNAQPNIGRKTTAKLFPEIVRQLVPDAGLIPIILILSEDNQFSHKFAKHIQKQGYFVGHFNGNAVFDNTNQVTVDATSSFAAGLSMHSNTQLDAIVFNASSEELIKTGLPFSYFNLCLVDADFSGEQCVSLLEMLNPACQGCFVLTKQNQAVKALAETNEETVLRVNKTSFNKESYSMIDSLLKK